MFFYFQVDLFSGARSEDIYQDLTPIINFYHYLLIQHSPDLFLDENYFENPCVKLIEQFNRNLSNYTTAHLLYSKDRKAALQTLFKICAHLKKERLYFLLFPISQSLLKNCAVRKLLVQQKYITESGSEATYKEELFDLHTLFKCDDNYANFRNYLSKEKHPSLAPVSLYHFDISQIVFSKKQSDRSLTSEDLKEDFEKHFPIHHAMLQKALAFPVKPERTSHPMLQLFWVEDFFSKPPSSLWSKKEWESLKQSEKEDLLLFQEKTISPQNYKVAFAFQDRDPDYETFIQYIQTAKAIAGDLYFESFEDLFNDLTAVSSLYLTLLFKHKPSDFFMSASADKKDYPIRKLVTDFANNLSEFINSTVLYAKDKKALLKSIFATCKKLKKERLYFLFFPIASTLSHSPEMQKILMQNGYITEREIKSTSQEGEIQRITEIATELSELKEIVNIENYFENFRTLIAEEKKPLIVALDPFYLEIGKLYGLKAHKILPTKFEQDFDSHFPFYADIVKKCRAFPLKSENSSYNPLLELFLTRDFYSKPPNSSWKIETWNLLDRDDKLRALSNNFTEEEWADYNK